MGAKRIAVSTLVSDALLSQGGASKAGCVLNMGITLDVT